MSESPPLYNSRLTKIYIQYLQKHYPDIDLDSILKDAGITRYEIDDPAHWFSQEQNDLFNDIVVARTGNPNISREAGRHSTLTEGLGATKQYILGLMSPTAIFLLIGKVYPLFSRAADVKSKKLGPTSVEIVAVPKPGVNEKLYQCSNRMGLFESTGQFFTDKFAHIEHPSCVHKGDDFCRYIITWNKTPASLWKGIRNYFLSFSILALLVFWFVIPFNSWMIVAFICAFTTLLLSYWTKYLENKALIKTIETQSETAQDSIVESNLRYNDALLIQEIGQAASNIFDINQLLRTVAGVMEKRLDFDRGMIMLNDKKETKLRYFTGYGQSPAEEAILMNTTFHLDNPKSKGVFVLAV